MFKKILVANRGDVAVRVMRACRELGVETVAIYSDADRNALHVRYADEAYPVGEGPARSSYLNISRIVDVAIRSEADAIHPGYGFLAENPLFSQACMEGGVIFIGPDSKTMRALSDRLWVRDRLKEADVPVVPLSRETAETDDFRKAAERIGFPLLVRPVAGSGGRGERLVSSPEDLEELLATASREAESAFGQADVYLEWVLPGGRHIEVHVLADGQDQVVYLGESEGTIRLRHQKLVEEAPSPAMTPELRSELGRAACDVARQVGYVGAGTVDFLLDKDGRYYFLHMSPRLSVEHSMLEMSAGVDYVKEQIRVASGRKLRYDQADIVPRGWAIECRIRAEDPYDEFKPSTGRIIGLVEPGGPSTRVESGVYEGFEVSHYYEPSIAKLAVWGEGRGEAILRMRRALSEYQVAGIRTNIPFLQKIMDRTSFIGGRFDATRDDEYVSGVRGDRDALLKVSALAGVMLHHRKRSDRLASLRVGRKPSAWKVAGRWEEMGE
jgi:acetyl/propionyl-CoA carboxylase alpha subunit